MWADQGIRTPVRNLQKKNKDVHAGDDYLRIDYAGWDGIVDSYRNFTRDYWETKAVYAQVYPAVEKISFTPGHGFLANSLSECFDFTDLTTVKIDWSIREDERVLASGTNSITGQPHAESTFKLPVEALRTVRAGKTYYAWFVFTNVNGRRDYAGCCGTLPVGRTDWNSVALRENISKPN